MPRCPGYPAYDNCNECELTNESCHPSQKRKKEKEGWKLIAEDKGEFESAQLWVKDEPEVMWPKNLCLGVSIDGRTNDIETYWDFTESTFPYTKFISFEPLLGPVDLEEVYVDWVIIGAMKRPRLKQPKWEWVQDILLWADEQHIPVFLKNNLELPSSFIRRQEFPTDSIIKSTLDLILEVNA